MLLFAQLASIHGSEQQVVLPVLNPEAKIVSQSLPFLRIDASPSATAKYYSGCLKFLELLTEESLSPIEQVSEFDLRAVKSAGID